MTSFWSRLGSLLRRRPKLDGSIAADLPVVELDQVVPIEAATQPAEPSVPPTVSASDSDTAAPDRPAKVPKPRATPPPKAPRVVPKETQAAETPSSLRIGVDFGTSTIQVAAYLEGRTPLLLRLEDLTDYMPSYFALEADGTPRFGTVAMNLPNRIHSVKPLLAEDAPIEGFGHPSKVTFLMLEEVVRRTILRLHDQGFLPRELDRLEISTNLGCTPTFELDARVRLRDVARRAGLNVQLASLIEEPVAAAFEVMLSGLVSDGTVLVIDMGGGTLDVAVVRISDGARSFELFSSGGSTRAGDCFTDIIAERIKSDVLDRVPNASFSRADETLIWQRAEATKVSLSARRSAVVGLGGIAGLADDTVELTREWFHGETRALRVHIEADVTNVYRMARLVLDRGGEFDPGPGTIDFEELSKGKVTSLRQVGLRDDAQLRIDHVVLVGGATNMPMISNLFEEIFGDKVIAPEIVGIDRSAIVAMGLSRPKPREMVNLRFPSWGVTAVFVCEGERHELPLYEPFAPTFKMSNGVTAEYRHVVAVPPGAGTVALAFQPIGAGPGTQWAPSVLQHGTATLTFEMNLFGSVALRAGAAELATTGQRAPWSPAEGDGIASWLPPWQLPREWWIEIPVWDPRND